MPLVDKLKGRKIEAPRERGFLWRGPTEDGVTQSMLGAWLVCRERFRLRYIEGWQEADNWNHRTGYGDMWHVCEEAFAAGENLIAIDNALRKFVQSLCSQYKLQQEQIVHWYQVCTHQFPEYIRYWEKHPEVVDRTPLFQEQVFDVQYQLPSGRIARLLGKWDSVELVGKGARAAVFLMENKTKGDIHEEQMRRQLTFDLQTMLYLVALQETKKQLPALWSRYLDRPILGVRYNVIRRPLSGGKGTITRHKAKTPKNGKHVPEETREEFYKRLVDDYIAKEPETYFMRWRVEISQADIDRFKRECLDPVLEQLCDWWERMEVCRLKGIGPFDTPQMDGSFGSTDRWPNALHFRMPYGVYSPLLDGGTTSLDEMLHSGSEVGLRRADRLFKELG